ncbi:DUF1684 domain-containing protein [Micromonospora cathayae]|uniref:DUF1684 domain-containing protein n=1 Tax=Micromonospora cathayae TaxID=3028804 RepID=A0ABY7ZKN9_9ACTN|nr:DUF1684 domain-containing protein [Micromonospora sp. HUAS 3]WDZ83554.1 DUF1684 domain-containing protein [Micromonospora sp. HUAS 3]
MTTAAPTSFVRDWQEWRRRRDAQLAAPHGFLAVTGLHWLTSTPHRLPDAPGEWQTGPAGVVVTLSAGEEIVVADRPVRHRYEFGPISERGGVTVGVEGGVVEVARRGGRDVVRPRRPDHPLRTGYRGTPTYPPDPRWVRDGRFVPYEPPRPTSVGATVEGLEHVYHALGRVGFEVDGLPLSLTVFEGLAPGLGLSILFTDATSGVTTYPANRWLAVDPPGPDGRVTLDFNRAVNLPCAYTDFATCPLPPPENRLPVAVEAGEQIPYERQPTLPAPAGRGSGEESA